ncbi:MAG: hypothetical protein VST68_08205 [Nitrospirota bacterium]|nr:hypothetical protein [Nitrospirota bacterium]
MGLFKKAVISPAQTQGRQDALFHGQGRRDFRARSDQKVHEGKRLEKRAKSVSAKLTKGQRTPLVDPSA